MSMNSSAALLLTFVSVAACGRPDASEEQATPQTAAPGAAAPTSAAPDTTEAAFWAHLQEANYQSWEKWPGMGELYPGTEPHGMLLTTYVNELARDALTNASAAMPAGAIIVKENYMPDSTLAAVTAMHKVSGYDAAHNDWYWAKWDPNGVVDVAGRVEMCAGCHGANARADYLMTVRPAR